MQGHRRNPLRHGCQERWLVLEGRRERYHQWVCHVHGLRQVRASILFSSASLTLPFLTLKTCRVWAGNMPKTRVGDYSVRHHPGTGPCPSYGGRSRSIFVPELEKDKLSSVLAALKVTRSFPAFKELADIPPAGHGSAGQRNWAVSHLQSLDRLLCAASRGPRDLWCVRSRFPAVPC